MSCRRTLRLALGARILSTKCSTLFGLSYCICVGDVVPYLALYPLHLSATSRFKPNHVNANLQSQPPTA